MKVEFNGTDKKIIVNNAITELDVQVDLYSDWKEWLKESDNSKYKPAMRTVGGDPTTGVKSVSPYFFLTNGWKIRPYEGDHTLTLSGNLFVDDPGTWGYNLTIPTIGDYTVTIVLSTTSDAIVVSAGSGLSSEEHDKLVTELPNAIAALPTTSDIAALPLASDNAEAIWNQTIAGHTNPGTFGEKIEKKLLTLGKFLGLK